jgi:NTE family protein
MAADVTRGQLLRLPQDYERYGLDPDEQSVADAVRASTSVPYLFEPFKLRHDGGESLLVDGGLISNYPIDIFDRTDGRAARWPTIGVTLIPQLPAGDTRLVPQLALLRPVPGFRFLESVVTTAVVGRDQGYLAQPWVKARSIEVDSLGVGPFDFTIDQRTAERLYESGRRAASQHLDA